MLRRILSRLLVFGFCLCHVLIVNLLSHTLSLPHFTPSENGGGVTLATSWSYRVTVKLQCKLVNICDVFGTLLGRYVFLLVVMLLWLCTVYRRASEEGSTLSLCIYSSC